MAEAGSPEPINPTDKSLSGPKQKPYRILESALTDLQTGRPFQRAEYIIDNVTVSLGPHNVNGALELALYDNHGKMIGEPQGLEAGRGDLEEAMETFIDRLKLGESPRQLLRSIKQENEDLAVQDAKAAVNELNQAKTDALLLEQTRKKMREGR